jgi:hypothetical protein
MLNPGLSIASHGSDYRVFADMMAFAETNFLPFLPRFFSQTLKFFDYFHGSEQIHVESIEGALSASPEVALNLALF